MNKHFNTAGLGIPELDDLVDSLTWLREAVTASGRPVLVLRG